MDSEVDNTIEEQVSTEVELPAWTGEGLGEPPPGHGFEAFTDESLDADPNVETTTEVAGTGEVEQPPAGAPEASGQQAAQAAETEPNEQEQPKGIEHDPRFKNLRRAQTQTALELRAERERAAQAEAALQQLATLLQQSPDGQPEFDPLDPNSVAAYIKAQVAQGTAQAQEVVQTEQQRAALRSSIDGAVNAFREAHPEVADGTELDIQVAEVVKSLQVTPEGQIDHELFPVTTENLEVALTLTKDPALLEAVYDLDLLPDEETLKIARDAMANEALYQEFKAQPALLDSDEGIAVAYRRAGLVQQVQQLPGQVQQAAQAGVKQAIPQQMRQRAHVETGGTGAPASSAPGARPGDDFDEVIQVHRQDNSSIFT